MSTEPTGSSCGSYMPTRLTDRTGHSPDDRYACDSSIFHIVRLQKLIKLHPEFLILDRHQSPLLFAFPAITLPTGHPLFHSFTNANTVSKQLPDRASSMHSALRSQPEVPYDYSSYQESNRRLPSLYPSLGPSICTPIHKAELPLQAPSVNK